MATSQTRSRVRPTTRTVPAPLVVPASSGAPDRAAIPWVTVLTLAVPLSLATTFWVVSLRTSLGSIARAGSPAASWARESALVLPFYVLAVLAALVLMRRRLGRDPAGLREVAGTGLLVAALASVVSVAQLALSSAYDYRLQMGEAAEMARMDGGCGAACQQSIQHATLALQERSVLIGGSFLLLTNLVLVVWVIAARGGRVPLVPARPVRERAGGLLATVAPAEALLAATLLGSAVVHTGVVGEHLAEWPAAAVFFVVLSVVEAGLAVAVLRRVRASWLVLQASVLASATPLLVWLVSRTVGMPFGPETGEPEAIGLADVVACGLEVAALVLAVLLLTRGRQATRTGVTHGLRLGLVLVVAVTALGLGGSGVSWLSLQADSAGMSADADA